MRGKRVTSTLADKHNGIHDVAQYQLALAMVDDCVEQYVRPRMYHVCLTNGTVDQYIEAIKLICLRLKRMGLRYRYKAAVEYSRKKQLHIHIFVITNHPREGAKNPCGFLNNDVGGKLHKLLHKVLDNPDENERLHHVATAQNAVQGYRFLELNNPERIADAKDWLSYMHKKETKLIGTRIYYSSREKGEKMT